MSTHASIEIKVRKTDVGKTMEFSPKGIEIVEWHTSERLEKSKCKPVTLTETLGIYCHEGDAGKQLLNHFNTYEKALNLILGGDISSIGYDSSLMHYANRKENITWEQISPERCFHKGIYRFLFDEEQGGWLVKDGDNFVPLTNFY